MNAHDTDHPPVDIEALATGDYHGIRFDTAALDQLVANFSALKDVHRVPLKIGHDATQPDGLHERDLTARLAFGWVEDLKRQGDKLIATVRGLPSALRQAINQRALRHSSVEVYRDWSQTEAGRNVRPDVRGLTLSALALIGSDVPRIRNIAELPRILADEADDGGTLVIEHVAFEEHDEQTMRNVSRFAAIDPATVPEKMREHYDRLRQRLRPLSMSERLNLAEKRLDAVRANTERNMRKLETMQTTTEEPLTFAARESLGERFLRELDERLQARNEWRPYNLTKRRETARELLLEWANTPAEDGQSLADVLEPADFEVAVRGAPIEARPEHLKFRPGVRPQERGPDDGRSRDPKVHRANPAPRETDPVRLLYTEKENRLRAIAKERRVSLDARHERETCEAIYFGEVRQHAEQDAVRNARDFDEAWHAAMRRQGFTPTTLRFAEHAARKRAAEIVRDEAPHLLSLNIEVAAAKQKKDAVAFREMEREVEAEIKRRNLDPLSAGDRADAWRRVGKSKPHLVPKLR